MQRVDQLESVLGWGLGAQEIARGVFELDSIDEWEFV